MNNKEKTFGEMIIELREKEGLTQQDLADKLYVSLKTIYKWENNINYPDIFTIPKVAQLLNMDIAELIKICDKK